MIDKAHPARLPDPMTPSPPAPATREALLEHQVETLTGELERLKAEVERLRQERTVPRLKIDAMARRLFGKSSERLDPAQLQMVFSNLALETEPAPQTLAQTPPAAVLPAGPDIPAAAPAVRKKRSLAELMEGLPVTVTTLTPPEVPACPEAWRAIGNAEQTRLLDYTPGRFGVHLIVRPKYVRTGAPHDPPVTAPLHLLQNRCMATPRLLAGMLTLRFEQHLPYYRIERLYARAGVPLSRQTLSCWAGMAAEACGLIITATKAEVFADGYVQADETPVKYQDPARKGSCGTGYLWVFYNPVRNLCYFAWRTGRGAACLENIVPPGFEGIIQCDGYSAYNSFIKARAATGHTIRLAGCLAHVRRKFFEARAEGEDAAWVLAEIRKLYRIEAELRESRAGPDIILTTRQLRSAPILQSLKTRLDDLLARRKHVPRSLTGEAITYALGQWDKLEVFLTDGRVQPDNNLTENAIRPTAIGKKNWLFMGDPKGGDRAAVFYTLITNCHRAGADAQAYLTDLFTRLPLPEETTRNLTRLTPHGWTAERQTPASRAPAAPSTAA